MTARTWPHVPPAPVRRLPWRPRVPLSLLGDDALDVLRHLSRGALRRALEAEAALRDGSDRSGPRWHEAAR